MSGLEELRRLEGEATKGPWVADTDVRGDCVVWGPNGRFLMNAQAEPHWMEYPGETRMVSFDVDRRDVKLIAAMRNNLLPVLDALDAVLALADRLDASNQCEDREIAEDIRAAITKALEGGRPCMIR